MEGRPFLERVRDAALDVAHEHRLWHEVHERLKKAPPGSSVSAFDPEMPRELYTDFEEWKAAKATRAPKIIKALYTSLARCLHPDWVPPPAPEFVDQRLAAFHGAVESLFRILDSREAAAHATDLTCITRPAKLYRVFRENITRYVPAIEVAEDLELAAGELTESSASTSIAAAKTKEKRNRSVDKFRQCPECWNSRSGAGIAYNTQGRTRYYKCKECGHKWTYRVPRTQ